MQELVAFERQHQLRSDPRFDELWTLVRSRTLLTQRLAVLDHQVAPAACCASTPSPLWSLTAGSSEAGRPLLLLGVVAAPLYLHNRGCHFGPRSAACLSLGQPPRELCAGQRRSPAAAAGVQAALRCHAPPGLHGRRGHRPAEGTRGGDNLGLLLMRQPRQRLAAGRCAEGEGWPTPAPGTAAQASWGRLQGRVACEMHSGDELAATEMVFAGALTELTPAEAAGLLSALVFQARTHLAHLLLLACAGALRPPLRHHAPPLVGAIQTVLVAHRRLFVRRPVRTACLRACP